MGVCLRAPHWAGLEAWPAPWGRCGIPVGCLGWPTSCRAQLKLALLTECPGHPVGSSSVDVVILVVSDYWKLAECLAPSVLHYLSDVIDPTATLWGALSSAAQRGRLHHRGV